MHASNTKFIIVLASAIAGSSSVFAGTPLSTQQNQFLRPFELSRVHVRPVNRFADAQQGNIRQRTEYGENFRYGRSVQGPLGDIIIWSPAPDNSYGKQPRPKLSLPSEQSQPGHRKPQRRRH